MDKEKLKNILNKVKEERISIEEATNELIDLPFKDISFAKIDTHRGLRRDFPEVILGEGKRESDIIKIVKNMIDLEKRIMITRVDESIYNLLVSEISLDRKVKYYREARIIFIGEKIKINNNKIINIITGGTSDIPIAEEAAVTAEIMGNKVEKIYDVGVAGLHRTLLNYNKIREGNVNIVVAGMDGALASVIAGIVNRPVIAVPTSIGYGANFNGISPLLSMLNSCAPGVAVVNIDNGFGAAYIASMINK